MTPGEIALQTLKELDKLTHTSSENWKTSSFRREVRFTINDANRRLRLRESHSQCDDPECPTHGVGKVTFQLPTQPVNIWEKFKADIEDCSQKCNAIGADLQNARQSPQFDEAYKVERDPLITPEFLDGLKVKVQTLYDFLYSDKSPLQ